MNVVTKTMRRADATLRFRSNDGTTYDMGGGEWVELRKPTEIVLQVSVPKQEPKKEA